MWNRLWLQEMREIKKKFLIVKVIKVETGHQRKSWMLSSFKIWWLRHRQPCLEAKVPATRLEISTKVTQDFLIYKEYADLSTDQAAKKGYLGLSSPNPRCCNLWFCSAILNLSLLLIFASLLLSNHSSYSSIRCGFSMTRVFCHWIMSATHVWWLAPKLCMNDLTFR